MNATTSTKFVHQLHETLKWAYKTAQYVIEKKNHIHKWNYNHKIRCTQLGIGAMVLLKRITFKGKYKIQNHWEDTIYCIEGQPYAGLPVFKISPVAGEIKVKIVTKICYSHLEATLKGSWEWGKLKRCQQTSGLCLGYPWWWCARDWGCVDRSQTHGWGGCNLCTVCMNQGKAKLLH